MICAEPWAGVAGAYGDGMLHNLSEFLVGDNSEDGESITVERKKKGKSSREYHNPLFRRQKLFSFASENCF